MLPLVFHPDVNSEIKHSYKWYQKQLHGLGDEFIQELEESFKSIRLLPNTWPKMGKSHRRFILSRFPYSVLYKIRADKEIFVLAVMHNHRKPGYWIGREQDPN